MHCTHPASIHTQLHSLYTMEYILTYIQTYIQTCIHTVIYTHMHTYVCTFILQTFFCLTRSSFGCAFRWLPLPLCLTLCSLSLSVCSSVWLSLRIVPSRFALLLSRFALSLSRLLSETCQTGLSYKPKIYIHTKHTHTHMHTETAAYSHLYIQRDHYCLFARTHWPHEQLVS